MEEAAPLRTLQLVLDRTGRGSRVTLVTVTTLGSVVNVVQSLLVTEKMTSKSPVLSGCGRSGKDRQM